MYKTENCACAPNPAPKLGCFSPGLQIPVEDIEMGTHLFPKQRRAHNERKETLQILRLCENSRSTIVGRFDMEFMQASDGRYGRALPRKQALGVVLWHW